MKSGGEEGKVPPMSGPWNLGTCPDFVLSGLLRNQEALVTSFYRSLRFIGRRRDGPWSALVLEKPGR